MAALPRVIATGVSYHVTRGNAQQFILTSGPLRKDLLMIHPNDANGDVLRRMEAHGDDLTKPRNIDFTVVFADGNSAEQFAQHFRALGSKVSVEFTETRHDFPWDVIVVQHMVPSHDGITNFENLLQLVADSWGGHNDGWGCLSEPTVN